MKAHPDIPVMTTAETRPGWDAGRLLPWAVGAAAGGFWLLRRVLDLAQTDVGPLVEILCLGLAGIVLLYGLHATARRAWPLADTLTAAGFILALFLSCTGLVQSEGYTFLHLVLIVPLAEELFFRGAVQGITLRSWGYLPAVVLTTALFVVLHTPAGPEAVIQLTVLALACSAVRMLNHGLLAAVLVHAAWNLAAISGPRLLAGETGTLLLCSGGFILAALLSTWAILPQRRPQEGRA